VIGLEVAKSSIELAKLSSERGALALPYLNLGKAYELMGDYVQAVENFEEAIEVQENSAAKEHDRPAVVLDMRLHLSGVQYLLGEKEALRRALELIEKLSETDEPEYNKQVWITGGYMRMADMVAKDDRKQALELLGKARKIIEANQDLRIRAKQLKKLEREI